MRPTGTPSFVESSYCAPSQQTNNRQTERQTDQHAVQRG